MIDNAVVDIQSSPDWRNMPVNRVGIRGLRHPMIFEDFTPSRGLTRQSVVARFDMLVILCLQEAVADCLKAPHDF